MPGAVQSEELWAITKGRGTGGKHGTEAAARAGASADPLPRASRQTLLEVSNAKRPTGADLCGPLMSVWVGRPSSGSPSDSTAQTTEGWVLHITQEGSEKPLVPAQGRPSRAPCGCCWASHPG